MACGPSLPNLIVIPAAASEHREGQAGSREAFVRSLFVVIPSDH